MRKLILAAASVAALALAGPAAAQSPIVIKFSHVVASNTPKGAAAEKFKELAEKYTGGKVKVEIYPNSTLYKDKEELEALQLGAVQMLAPSNSKFGPIGVKEFEVFDLPYILPDLVTLRKVTDGPLGARLLKLLDSKGMTGLAYWDNGFKQMSANKKLVTPADYKGVKFRIQSSKVLEAIPQVMAFGEVYQALQTGVVDGQENTWSNIYTQKMHEVQKYATVTNHGYIGYVVVVNKKFWDGLPADIRTNLDKAMKEATAYGNGQSAKENEDALAEIKKSGKTEIITLTPEQDTAMRKAMEPVYKDVATRVGQPLIDEFLKETGQAGH
jgi:C4-dicarboxylate-binding protein DctP